MGNGRKWVLAFCATLVAACGQGAGAGSAEDGGFGGRVDGGFGRVDGGLDRSDGGAVQADAGAASCSDPGDCTTCEYANAPTKISECECPVCPQVAMTKSECQKNRDANNAVCSPESWSGWIDCPIFDCPDVAVECNAGGACILSDQQSCAAQAITVVGDCAKLLGWSWNGSSCEAVSGCSCQNQCDDLFASEGDCWDVYTGCEPLGGYCLSSGTCPGNQYCQFWSYLCGGEDIIGTCLAKPTSCDPIGEPVCGCDGNEYMNECEAHSAGVSVQSPGPC